MLVKNWAGTGLFGKKLVHLVLVVFIVSFLTFLFIDYLPGDAAHTLAGYDASEEEIAAIREELGLGGTLPARFLDWLRDALTGDLGVSSISREPVVETILSRLPVTVELIVLSQLLALALAVPAALVCASRAHGRIDRALTGIAFGTMSTPVFVMALLLIYVFAVRLQWLPATGYVALSDGLWQNLKAFALPAMSIALVEWVPLMRVLRSDMITTLQKNYILSARAKGLPPGRILFGHALRPSSFTLLTILGLHIGHMIGGALLVETIFALPGLGRLFIGAIFNQDIKLVQGCILFITVAYVAINFTVDLLYGVLDPRLRRGNIRDAP